MDGRLAGPVIWRAWGRRLYTGPAVAVFLAQLLWGWMGFAVVAGLVAAGVLAVVQSGLMDRVVAHEEGHVLRCRIRRTWHRSTRRLSVADSHPHVKRWIRIRDGVLVFRAKPAHGTHSADWVAAGPALAMSWHASDVEVVDRTSKRDGSATGEVEVRVSSLGVPARLVPWPRPPGAASWTAHNVPVGVGAGGRVETVSVVDPVHMLVAGPTGGGKSTFLKALMLGLAWLDDVALFVIDMKGTDFQRLAARCSGLAYSPEDARATLAYLIAVMETRNVQMRRDGEETWTGLRLVCVIDEFADLDPGLHPAVETIARKGRSAGIELVICTQRPVSTLGQRFTTIRSQLGTRVALGAMPRSEAALVIGEDALLPATWPRLPSGTAFVQGHGRGRLVRGYWPERADVDWTTEETAGRRPRVPEGLVLS